MSSLVPLLISGIGVDALYLTRLQEDQKDIYRSPTPKGQIGLSTLVHPKISISMSILHYRPMCGTSF